jgi:hypothetical protein
MPSGRSQAGCTQLLQVTYFQVTREVTAKKGRLVVCFKVVGESSLDARWREKGNAWGGMFFKMIGRSRYSYLG